MKGFLVSLLCVMFFVVVFFNALGIAYSTNDFVGTMVTVENGLGKVSNVCLSLYEKAKEFFLSGADLLGSIYDATIGKLITWLEEKFDFDFSESISSVYDYVTRELTNNFKRTKVMFEFIGRYGFSLSTKYFERFSAFSHCVYSADFWTDYKNCEGFLWDEVSDYISALVDFEENQFSYLVYQAYSDNVSSKTIPNKNTVLINTGWNIFGNDPALTDYDDWFVTVDLSLPEGYGNNLSHNTALRRYFDYYWIPDGSSSLTYYPDDGDLPYYLTGIRLKHTGWFTSSEDSILRIEDQNFIIMFEFSYIYDGNVVTSIWISPNKYYGTSQVYFSVADGMFLRADENDRYS